MTINVEVVFALPDRQKLVALSVPDGSIVADAIARSGIREHFPDQDLDTCEVAVWGKHGGRDQPLCDGDRIELLRPLATDPREARRELAKEGRSMGNAGRRPS